MNDKMSDFTKMGGVLVFSYIKRIALFVLLLCVTAVLFCSCGDEKDDEAEAVAEETTEEVTETETTEKATEVTTEEETTEEKTEEVTEESTEAAAEVGAVEAAETAYRDYLSDKEYKCDVIFVNDDEVPELYIETGEDLMDCFILVYDYINDEVLSVGDGGYWGVVQCKEKQNLMYTYFGGHQISMEEYWEIEIDEDAVSVENVFSGEFSYEIEDYYVVDGEETDADTYDKAKSRYTFIEVETPEAAYNSVDDAFAARYGN